jgi:DNA-directed RNA polymerase specialized sigma24 family protein
MASGPESQLEVVRRAAEAGARSVVSNLQLVRDAGQRAVEKWLEKAWRRNPVARIEGWAWRVGRNEAIRLGRGNKVSRGNDVVGEMPPGTGCESRVQGKEEEVEPLLRDVEAALPQLEFLLTSEELSVVCVIQEVGTLNGAAKALGMDPSNLRRVFQLVLGKLEGAGG